MNEEKKLKEKKEEPKADTNEVPKDANSKAWRKVIIETDGTNIRLVLAEVAGNLELLAILQSLIGGLSEKK